MSFLRWCEHCRAVGIQSPVCRFRITSTEVVQMCKRLDCIDLLLQNFEKCSVQKGFPNCSKQVTAPEDQCQAPWPSAFPLLPAPINSFWPRKTRKTCAIEGAPSSSTKEPADVGKCTSAESLSAIPGQELVQDKNGKEPRHAVEGTPSSSSRKLPIYISKSTISGQDKSWETCASNVRKLGKAQAANRAYSSPSKPLVYVSKSTSSEPFSAISGQELVQDENGKKTGHGVEGTPLSSSRKRPIYISKSTISGQDKSRETCASNVRKLGKAQAANHAYSSPRKPLVYVSKSTSSEPFSAISGQELVQDENGKKTGHAVEGTRLSSSRKRPIYISKSTISGQDKSRETCASNVRKLGKAQAANPTTWSVMGRAWSAAAALAIPGETLAEESDFVSGNSKNAVEDRSGESKDCERAATSPASYNSLENRVKYCVLADKASESVLVNRTSKQSDSMCHAIGSAVKLRTGEAESPVVSHGLAAALALGSSALRVAPHVSREESTESTHTHESQRLAAASVILPVAPSTPPQKQEMSSQTFQYNSPAALKPLSYVFGLRDRSEVGLSGNLTGAGVTTAAELPRCCQKVDAAKQAFANKSAAVVKSMTDVPRLPENGKVGLREDSAVAGRSLFISPPSLLQEEKAVHSTGPDHYLERNEGDVLESFTAVAGTSSSELLCLQETQAGSGTVGSHATGVEEPGFGLPHEGELGLRESSGVTRKTSTIRPPTLVQEEDAGHQATATEHASSSCLLPHRSNGGVPVSFMGTGGRSPPEFPTFPHEQQANFETVQSYSPVVEKPVSDFSGIPTRNEVGPQESSDVAGKLSSVALPTLPHQDEAVHQTVSEHSYALVEPTNHTYSLPDRIEGGVPEFLATVSGTLSLGPPTCLQEQKVGFENLGLTAAVEKPTRDLCGLPDGDGASLQQSPAVVSETLPVGLAIPLHKEQETSEHSMNSNNSSLTKPCGALVACGFSSLELPAPSADHTYAVVNSADIPSCVPDINELDLQGNPGVASELSVVGSLKYLPERLEDSEKKASCAFAPVPDYICEENLSIGAEVSLREVISTTPSLDTSKTLQEKQGGTENTVGHLGAVGVPCHTNQIPSLLSTSVVSLLGPVEDTLSATLHIAESMSKLKSNRRIAGCHDSAPATGCTTETSLSIRDEEVNTNTPSAKTTGTLQIELGGTSTNQVSGLSNTSNVDLLVSDEDPLSTTLRIAESMSKLPTDRPRIAPSAVGCFQQIILPSTTAVTVKETADVRGAVGMPAHSGKGGDSKRETELTGIPFAHPFNSGETVQGGGSGHFVPTVVAGPLAGVLSGSNGQERQVSSCSLRGQAIVVTATRIVEGTRKMERILVMSPSRNTVAGQGSQAVQSANTRAGGLKRPHSSASSEKDGDAPSWLDSRTKVAIMKKMFTEDHSKLVGQTYSVTKGGACAPKSAISSELPKQVVPSGKGKRAAARSRQPAAAQNRQLAVPRTGRTRVSDAQRKGKLPRKCPEQMVPDVLHSMPSPLSSELSSASSQTSNDGSSGPADNRSVPCLSAKRRKAKSSAEHSSSTSVSKKSKFLEVIQNRVRQNSTSTSSLPGYHSVLASRPLYRDEVPVKMSKCKRTFDKGIGDVEMDLDHYIAELSNTKDLEQYDSVLSDLFDSCT